MKFLFVLLACYLALAAAMYLMQPRLLYLAQPMSPDAPTPASVGLAYEDVWLATADGLRLHGWYLPAADADSVILFFHGNAGNIADRLQTAQLLTRLGADLLMIDYRGYGLSQGRPDEAGTYADAQAAWHHLLAVRGWEPRQVIVWGRSLGGAVASWLVARHPAAALVVESSFSSLPDLGAELYPWLPVRWLSRFRYDSRQNLAAVRSPVLIIHSRSDEIIPFHHAEALYAAAPEPRQLLRIDGGHNGGYLLDPQRYLDGIRDFIDRNGLRDPL